MMPDKAQHTHGIFDQHLTVINLFVPDFLHHTQPKFIFPALMLSKACCIAMITGQFRVCKLTIIVEFSR